MRGCASGEAGTRTSRAIPPGSHQFQRPEQLHRARHEQRADDRHVEEDRHREPEPELLQADDRAGHEAHEGGEHDQPGRGHDPAGLREPVATASALSSPLSHSSRMRLTRKTS